MIRSSFICSSGIQCPTHPSQEELVHPYHVRRGATRTLVALVIALAGCGDDSTGPEDRVITTSVTVRNDFFTPSDIQVSPGAVVTWTMDSGGLPHNVTFAPSVAPPSGTLETGTFQLEMPTTAGTYNYQCTFHSGMNGSVLVQ
jgi:plastocyanin